MDETGWALVSEASVLCSFSLCCEACVLRAIGFERSHLAPAIAVPSQPEGMPKVTESYFVVLFNLTNQVPLLLTALRSQGGFSASPFYRQGNRGSERTDLMRHDCAAVWVQGSRFCHSIACVLWFPAMCPVCESPPYGFRSFPVTQVTRAALSCFEESILNRAFWWMTTKGRICLERLRGSSPGPRGQTCSPERPLQALVRESTFCSCPQA